MSETSLSLPLNPVPRALGVEAYERGGDARRLAWLVSLRVFWTKYHFYP